MTSKEYEIRLCFTHTQIYCYNGLHTIWNLGQEKYNPLVKDGAIDVTAVR